jgi:hypothetical protein
MERPSGLTAAMKVNELNGDFALTDKRTTQN